MYGQNGITHTFNTETNFGIELHVNQQSARTGPECGILSGFAEHIWDGFDRRHECLIECDFRELISSVLYVDVITDAVSFEMAEKILTFQKTIILQLHLVLSKTMKEQTRHRGLYFRPF